MKELNQKWIRFASKYFVFIPLMLVLTFLFDSYYDSFFNVMTINDTFMATNNAYPKKGSQGSSSKNNNKNFQMAHSFTGMMQMG